MKLEDTINSFIDLGHILSRYVNDDIDVSCRENFLSIIKNAQLKNPWFTRSNVLRSIESISTQLESKNLNDWIDSYKIVNVNPRNILVIMAGNIPLVGFYDFLSVMISGHNITVKLSSQDSILFPFIFDLLCSCDNRFSDRLNYIENVRSRKFDAVIATGSDSSAMHFEYYFRDLPKVVRKNRKSIAVINGLETNNDLEKLSDDIFLYFGLGCRNVSKLFLPSGYDLDCLFSSFFEFSSTFLDHQKYMNNYDYNKAVFLMGQHKFLDNGFLIMKEDMSFHSPVSVLYYEFYDNLSYVNNFLTVNEPRLQCVVSNDLSVKKSVRFGESQSPSLFDYPDNIDLLEFLMMV